MKKTIAIFLTGIISINLSAQSGEDNFKTVCAACHTIGKGLLVGPDLKGSHNKHQEKWLIKWIKSSQTMVNEGDKKAVELFNQYNQIPMPDNPQFSDADAKAIIAYIKKESGDNTEAAAVTTEKKQEEITTLPATSASAAPATEIIEAQEVKNTKDISPANSNLSDKSGVTAQPVGTIPPGNNSSGNTFLFLGIGLGALFFLSVLALLGKSVITLSKELKKKYDYQQ